MFHWKVQWCNCVKQSLFERPTPASLWSIWSPCPKGRYKEDLGHKTSIPFTAPIDDRQFQVVNTVADESHGAVRMTLRLTGTYLYIVSWKFLLWNLFLPILWHSSQEVKHSELMPSWLLLLFILSCQSVNLEFNMQFKRSIHFQSWILKILIIINTGLLKLHEIAWLALFVRRYTLFL